jgi:hypothetical protein
LPSTKIQTIYLTADGRYHKRTCVVPSELGSVVENHRDRQAHLLDEHPIFSGEKRGYAIPVGDAADQQYVQGGVIKTWEQITEIQPRNVPVIPDRMTVIVEDQNAFPLTTNPAPSVLDRHHSFIRVHEQGVQRAQSAAARSDLENPFLGPVAVISACVAALAAIFIALIWALNRFGAEEPVAALPILLGATLALPWRKSKDKPVKEPKAAKAKKVRAAPLHYETLYLYCEVSNRIMVMNAPFEVLAAHLPLASRFIPDVLQFRKMWAMVGAIVVYGLTFAALINLVVMPVAAVAALVFSPLGLLGWYIGPSMMYRTNPPIWIARRTPYELADLVQWQSRILAGDPDAPDLADILLDEPVVTGYTHTHGCGMPLPLFDQQVASIMTMPEEDESFQTRAANSLLAQTQPEEEYIPALFNSHTLHELLPMRDEKAMFRGGLGRGQTLQIGGILVLAGASIVIMFLVMMSQSG